MKFVKKIYKIKYLFCILIILNIIICKDSTGLIKDAQNDKNSIMKQNLNLIVKHSKKGLN